MYWYVYCAILISDIIITTFFFFYFFAVNSFSYEIKNSINKNLHIRRESMYAIEYVPARYPEKNMYGKTLRPSRLCAKKDMHPAPNVGLRILPD